MRAILLAGGNSTRLYPATWAINKHMLPVYDKPMIYYPLSLLMAAGIREILVISNQATLEKLWQMMSNGEEWGLDISYELQKEPNGIAEAFIIGKQFIWKDNVCLMLGDNIFYGHGLPEQLQRASQFTEITKNAVIFAYAVKDPERYGVVEFDENNNAIGIEEKPLAPRSKYAVPGIYFYDNQVVEIAENLKPSARGELEITDVNNVYIEKGQCKVEVIGRGTAWLDAGTHEALLQASNFVQAIQERQGILIASPEEVAYRMGYIDFGQLQELAGKLSSSPYGQYLLNIPETI
jgi:glucose-1-phosphate thymidylyltransferase